MRRQASSISNGEIEIAVNWRIIPNSELMDIHPSNKSLEPSDYWISRYWPDNLCSRVVGICISRLEKELDRRLPIAIAGSLRIALRLRGERTVIAFGSRLGIPLSWMMKLKKSRRFIIVDNALSEYTRSERCVSNKIISRMLRNTDLLVTHSTGQCDIYRNVLDNGRTRYRFIRWGMSPEEVTLTDTIGEYDYAFSCGDAYRDYDTLCKAVRDTGIRVKIASTSLRISPGEIPSEIEYLGRVPFNEYRRIMAESRLVIVPLNDCRVSQGQMAIVQAMGIGKTVIATKTLGTSDYINDGIDGFLIPPNSAVDLRRTLLEIWDNKDTLEMIGEKARQKVQRDFTEEQLAINLLQEIEALENNENETGCRHSEQAR